MKSCSASASRFLAPVMRRAWACVVPCFSAFLFSFAYTCLHNRPFSVSINFI
ncbi:hypothetical protein L208DRAFT_647332 [Tricholoma matsutake]|nr:hypothetical protein L208DRAFT_647332 [Tricholoma matsutake 945]